MVIEIEPDLLQFLYRLGREEKRDAVAAVLEVHVSELLKIGADGVALLAPEAALLVVMLDIVHDEEAVLELVDEHWSASATITRTPDT